MHGEYSKANKRITTNSKIRIGIHINLIPSKYLSYYFANHDGSRLIPAFHIRNTPTHLLKRLTKSKGEYCF